MKTHGHAKREGKESPTYCVWRAMVQRTTNPAHRSFVDYANVGIDRSFLGKGGFARFLEVVGERPSTDYTLDRIDPTRGYEPGNLRWATKLQQEANKIRRQWYGRSIEEWAGITGVRPNSVHHRLARGWDHSRVFPVEFRR